MIKSKIVVVGLGYVGLSNSILLAQDNTVTALDIDSDKVQQVNQGKSPISDKKIMGYLQNKNLDLHASEPFKGIYKSTNYVLIATPTNYDEQTNQFNTSLVEGVIKQALDENPRIKIIIRSTVPVGFTESMIKKFKKDDIFFVPEFLREGKALYDNLFPSRILIGGYGNNLGKIGNLFKNGARKKNIKVLCMSPSEAESAKLFSNTYLALRIAFFNELDSFAKSKNLQTKKIIDALSQDKRIGSDYNNPSFGYGGYCLPKDTKQLLTSYDNVPQRLVEASIQSNEVRKIYIANEILKLKLKTVGVYRLSMKKESDNFRESSILDIIRLISSKGPKIIIYEPLVSDKNFEEFEVINDFEKFSTKAEIILANRMNNQLDLIKDKVFTRDIFNKD